MPNEQPTSEPGASRHSPVTIADVDAAFHRLESPPRRESLIHLEETLVAYTEVMKQKGMLPEHLIISVRVAALNAMPHLSDERISAAIKLCLDRYFPE